MKIFVSYSRRDAGDFAEQIQRHFASFEHYDVFTDVDRIAVGDIWSNSIEENISNCDIFVVIVTYGALQSSHVENEVLQAQSEKKRIIPCFYGGVRDNDIKWGLNTIQGVEFEDKYELARNLYSSIIRISANVPSTKKEVSKPPIDTTKQEKLRQPSITKSRIWVIISGGIVSAVLIYILLANPFPPPSPIEPTNTAPVALGENVTTNQNESISLLLKTRDAQNDSLHFIIERSPSHGTLTGVAPNITYTPQRNYIGNDSFTYRASDGKADSNIGTVTMNVRGVNNPPVPIDLSSTTKMNTPINIELEAKDQDQNDSLTAEIVSSPSSGALGAINQNTGIVTYTPNPGFVGTDQFTFKVNDGKVDSSNVGTVRIQVNQQVQQSTNQTATNATANNPPVPTDQSLATTMNTRLDITLSANDKDNNDLTAAIVSNPMHGTLSDINQNTGVVTYTPNPGFVGTDQFTFKVNDGKVDSSNVGTVRIQVS